MERAHESEGDADLPAPGGDTSLFSEESPDSEFTADITFDAEGLVVDYPGLGRRV